MKCQYNLTYNDCYAGWVAQTFKKSLFFLGSITRETSLVLINVLYFNGKWKKEFNKKLERQTFFKLQNNPTTRISADYMNGDVTAGYLKTPTGTEILSIPFEDENYSMVFVIPQTG